MQILTIQRVEDCRIIHCLRDTLAYLCKPRIAVWLSLAVPVPLIYQPSAIAQVTPDGTLSTTVSSSDNLNFVIEAGNQSGRHLFHSFDKFSVPTNGSAQFNNARGIRTIFSRVTGGNISEINGELSTNHTATLFLMNPSGIIFGKDASLNIGGSFFLGFYHFEWT